MNTPDTDQWKTDGNCGKCRRRNYCHKTCRANKARIETYVNEQFMTRVSQKGEDGSNGQDVLSGLERNDTLSD